MDTGALEWVVLATVAVLAAAYIAWPRGGDEPSERPEAAELRAERAALLQQLREIEDDAVAGRITAEDRAQARRALAPPLRAVTEALRDLGETRAAAADKPGPGEPTGRVASR